MLKKLFFGFVAFTLAVGLFSACGKQSSGQDSEGSTTQAEETTSAESTTQAADTDSAESATQAAGDVTVVKVGTMGTYSPYSYEDESGKLTGYDLEVLRKVQEVDPSLQFEFIAGPWDSLFVGLDSDKFQMIANQITSTAEREEKYYLTDNSYYTCVDQLIVKAGRTDISSFEDLKGKTIGLTVGDAHNAVAEKWNEEHDNALTINYYEQDITAILQDIENGRIDATVNDPAVAESKAETQGLEVQAVGEWLSESPTYFIFKQDEQGKALKEKIDAALAKLKDSGELSKLSEDWFGADYTR